ncbi:valine dehydrogenase [Pseudonocardia sp. CNS-004]|nr:valine dehydrogenase [Pseudonocardia sp. CNS-004]
MTVVDDIPTDRLRVFDHPESRESPHERVLFCHDPDSGLRAIIAIHSLALGPAIGGCRMYPYPDEAAAVTDVLRLSRGMTFKAAVAGLDHGGAKAVIIGNPRTDKRPELFEAFGRCVDELGGRYVTAGDVGTDSDEMDIIGRTTRHVAFRSTAAGGSGDSGLNTALGVFQAMRAGAEARWGTSSLAGRRVGVEGLGKVGHRLTGLLVEAGAEVVASDIDERAVGRTRAAFPGVRFAPEVLAETVDVYAPCAMGGTLDTATAEALAAQVVCGGANNQLTHPGLEAELVRRGIVWVPDFLANAGGLIQAAVEVADGDAADARRAVEAIFDTARRVIADAAARGTTTGTAAADLALRRIRTAEAAGRERNAGPSGT